ncbi:hypothetical protein JKP88DRAFT_205337, partial [Tribonema minus]
MPPRGVNLQAPVWAKLANYPFWPARYANEAEAAKASSHRKSQEQVCVFFLGSNNLAWVPKDKVIPLDRASLTRDPSCKHKNKAFHRGLQMASEMLDKLPGGGGRRQRSQPVEAFSKADKGFCQACAKSCEEGTIIVCDGCTNEYHLQCCRPPISRPPKGDWFCHDCTSRPSKMPPAPPGTPMAG